MWITITDKEKRVEITSVISQVFSAPYQGNRLLTVLKVQLSLLANITGKELEALLGANWSQLIIMSWILKPDKDVQLKVKRTWPGRICIHRTSRETGVFLLFKSKTNHLPCLGKVCTQPEQYKHDLKRHRKMMIPKHYPNLLLHSSQQHRWFYRRPVKAKQHNNTLLVRWKGERVSLLPIQYSTARNSQRNSFKL